ncbi:hypothetical protein [Tenacibaculum sp. IB213877]|uniref:hypothetical protein n=1 Tax=Tenacibaculum sp. IB213877 TaxID=3097351 RepID=UPI002A5A91E5|nr:hypothetical protein [Tenacibaculum sp. IB213877]MDY0779354.1 hypothetical protein [Tenacibaculum sp. IB213877]
MKALFLTIMVSFSLNLMGQNFEGKLVNVNFSYPIKNVSYCSFNNYIISKQKIENNNYLKDLKEKYSDNSLFEQDSLSLEVLSMIKLNFQGREVAVVSYKEEKENQKLIFFSYESKKLLELFINISKLSNNSFWQFYNDIDDEKFPEINKLKPLVKDANGVLNIEKLAQVIKDNKASLRKYLDE